MPGWDIDGFFTSTEFITRLATFITAVLSLLAGQFVEGLFATPIG